MAKDRLKILSQTVRKIPLFTGLSPSHIETVLKACQLKRYEASTEVCARATAPDEMYILLSGELEVLIDDGTRVATLTPVATVGELGIFTRQERKATVSTLSVCNLLVIQRLAFERVLESDRNVQARIFRNVVDIVAEKIVQDNVRMRDHVRDKIAQERRVGEYQRRLELAVNMLVDAGMNRDEVQARLDEQLMESRMRVLIVDDEEDIRRLLREALADCDSLEASGGEEALETLQQESPDLVITDIRMPGTDGLTLLAKVKERFPNLPVLGISGMVNDDDIHEYGFDAFMEKPMDLRELRELVDQTVEKDSV